MELRCTRRLTSSTVTAKSLENSSASSNGTRRTCWRILTPSLDRADESCDTSYCLNQKSLSVAGHFYEDFRSSQTGAKNLRSEEHTSELQSLTNLVCRLLLEKKKQKHYNQLTIANASIHHTQ